MFQNKAPCLGIVIVTWEAWFLQGNRGLELPTSFTAEAMTPHGKETKAGVLKMRDKSPSFAQEWLDIPRKQGQPWLGGQ